MNSTYDLHDIVLYNHQGTLKTAIIVKVIMISDSELYEMDNSATILREDILTLLGNAATISEDFYGSNKNNLP